MKKISLEHTIKRVVAKLSEADVVDDSVVGKGTITTKDPKTGKKVDYMDPVTKNNPFMQASPDPVKMPNPAPLPPVRKKDMTNEAKDDHEYGYEGEMVISQLKTMMRRADELMKMLKPDTDLPEWVQSKITLAQDYVQTAADYMASEMNEEFVSTENKNNFKSVTEALNKMKKSYVHEDNAGPMDPSIIARQRMMNQQNDGPMDPSIIARQNQMTSANNLKDDDEIQFPGNPTKYSRMPNGDYGETETIHFQNPDGSLRSATAFKNPLPDMDMQSKQRVATPSVTQRPMGSDGRPYMSSIRPDNPLPPQGSFNQEYNRDRQYDSVKPQQYNSADEIRKLFKESTDYLLEKLTKATSVDDVIHDFVHSDDKRFAGKDKKERIRMALGAYYKMHPEKSKKKMEEEVAMYESRMPRNVISDKMSNAEKTPEQLLSSFKNVLSRTKQENDPAAIEKHARSRAWSHGYGKNSDHYWKQIKHLVNGKGLEETKDSWEENPPQKRKTDAAKLANSVKIPGQKTMKESLFSQEELAYLASMLETAVAPQTDKDSADVGQVSSANVLDENEMKKRGRPSTKDKEAALAANPNLGKGRDPREHIQVQAGRAMAGVPVDFKHNNGEISKITAPMGRKIVAHLNSLKPKERQDAVRKMHASADGLKV
jgi:hypothetical protein